MRSRPDCRRSRFPLTLIHMPIAKRSGGRQSVLSAACKGCSGGAMPPTTIDELPRTIPIVAPHNRKVNEMPMLSSMRGGDDNRNRTLILRTLRLNQQPRNPLTHYRFSGIWKRHHCDTAEQQIRNPVSRFFLFDGLPLLRYAERQENALLSQLPPRWTRCEPVDGPFGSTFASGK